MTINRIPAPGAGSGSGGLDDVTGTLPVVVEAFGTDRVVSIDIDQPTTGTGGLPGVLGSMARRRIEYIAAMDGVTNIAGDLAVFNPTPSAAVTAGNSTYYASCVRARWNTSATINVQAGTEIQYTSQYRGLAYNTGGFLWEFVFGFHALNADSRFLAGIAGTSTAASDPSTNLANCYVFGMDSADTNIQVMHNDANVGTCTKIDLGSDFPRPTVQRDVYYASLYCTPASPTVEYFLMRMDDPTKIASGTIYTDMPAASTVRPARIYVGTGPTTATVCSLDIMRAQLTSVL